MFWYCFLGKQGAEGRIWWFHEWMVVVFGVLDGGETVGEEMSVNYGTKPQS